MSANKVHCNKMLISDKMFVLNKIFVFNKFILTVNSIMIKNDAARKKMLLKHLYFSYNISC